MDREEGGGLRGTRQAYHRCQGGWGRAGYLCLLGGLRNCLRPEFFYDQVRPLQTPKPFPGPMGLCVQPCLSPCEVFILKQSLMKYNLQ